MVAKTASPRSQQRLRILDAYRSRGRKDNNLFLVYSVKTDRDWILPSDRQFVHWIHYLETNPEVRSFNLAPDLVISTDVEEVRGTELDAEAEMQDGHREWHEVKSAESERENARSQLLAQAAASWREGAKYRLFTDKDLAPHMPSSIVWLKIISYASALRDLTLTHDTALLLSVLERRQRGTIGDLLQDAEISDRDPAVLLGVLARFAITGPVSLDLSEMGFGNGSMWTWRAPH